MPQPNNILFTSESVSEWHPEKVCDQISDATLDAYHLSDDPDSRVGIETLCTKDTIVLAGECRSKRLAEEDDHLFPWERLDLVAVLRQSI